MSAKDIEYLVCIAVEVDDLVEQVAAAGLGATIYSLLQDAFSKHQVDATYIPDVVQYHLHPDDADRRDRVVAILGALANDSAITP